MGNRIYVGNLAYSVTDDSLQRAFSAYGSVTSAKVMIDRDSGRSKGLVSWKWPATNKPSTLASACG